MRGKASADVEFGAKISVALVDGYAFWRGLVGKRIMKPEILRIT